ncbi:MAG: hypothetical protein DME33_07990 [Verrucomicrobia bacterium]|nr:MAG: hypothetical protein DME33_07990 [Verrucomicrobiota bacterium]
MGACGEDYERDLQGSARVSRVGDGVLANADFFLQVASSLRVPPAAKDCFGATPKPGRRGDRYLIM